ECGWFMPNGGGGTEGRMAAALERASRMLEQAGDRTKSATARVPSMPGPRRATLQTEGCVANRKALAYPACARQGPRGRGDSLLFTDREKQTLTATWGQLVPLADAWVDVFYRRLFELRPEYRTLFPLDM